MRSPTSTVCSGCWQGRRNEGMAQLLPKFQEVGGATCPTSWCAGIPDEIDLDTPCTP